jgi:hypothetical protein
MSEWLPPTPKGKAEILAEMRDAVAQMQANEARLTEIVVELANTSPNASAVACTSAATVLATFGVLAATGLCRKGAVPFGMGEGAEHATRSRPGTSNA